MRKVMQSVRIEAKFPMRVRVSREINGRMTHAEEFEIGPTADIAEVQKEVMAAARGWKASFEVGVRFVVERLPYETGD